MVAIEKSAKALRTIRELADELALEPYVLRFWEKEFKQLKPIQRENGRRYYRPEDVDLARQIQTLLHDQGYTIKGAKAVLSGKADPSDLATQLRPIQNNLRQIREKIAAAV